jgi:hypothetical protein
MLVSPELNADFSRRCAHLPPQPPSSATHPPLRNTREPESHCRDSGRKRITSRATVDGDLAWDRGKLPPAHCQSTARMPPKHRAAYRRHVPQSIACRCAPHRRNSLFWQPRSRHQLVYVVVEAVLDAGVDTATPRGPQAVADPALPEGCHARRGRPV